MDEGLNEFHRAWEDRYRENPKYRNHYPFNSVVSFVFRHKPGGRPLSEIRILEVGCGNGANLWFAAREGFRVAGIDASETAIQYAQDWFARESLQGDLRVGDFASLPFDDQDYDLVIDRGALSFCATADVRQAIDEIHRVIRPGGCFLFTPYSDRCSSFDGLADDDGCYRSVSGGSIIPGAPIRFYGVADVRSVLAVGWDILSMEHHENCEMARVERTVHAEWSVVAQRRVSS